ncbi:MAG: helix-turn-helix domain-containing protein [Spirochaetia bacterium]|nr:helix-turn-helix domain-containing protein [Spirochaetia bacterium]
MIEQSAVGLKNPFDFRFHVGSIGGSEITPHVHHFTEVTLTLEGRILHRYDDRKTTLQRGSVYVIPRGASHALGQAKGWRYLNIYFLSEGLESRLPGSPEESSCLAPYLASEVLEWRIPERTFSTAKKILALLSEKSAERMKGRHLFEQSLIQSLLILFGSETSGDVGGLKDRRVGSWQTFVRENADLSAKELLSKIAETEGLSPPRVSKIFLDSTGESFQSRLLRAKILKSCNDLLLGELSITDIAQRYGFFDLAHFSRLFKRVTAMTPRDYRDSFKGAEKR